MKSMQQRVAMITGGNSGIGFAISAKLASSGFHVILASRNQQKSADAIQQINRLVPGASMESIPLDLASFDSIRKCVDIFHSRQYPLHLLINHAGGLFPGKQASFTRDGFEMTFGTNHLGHFLLTNLLLSDLKRSAPSRVITVSSRLHIPGYGYGPRPNFDYENLKAEKYYNDMVFYKNSKLANIWFAYELNRQLNGSRVTSNAVCPGFVPESIAEKQKSRLSRWFYREFMARMPFARSADEAASSVLFVATDPRYETVGGKFIVDQKEINSSPESYDLEKAQQLWDASVQWCQLSERQ